MKTILLNSFFNDFAIALRDRYRILAAAFLQPEELGPLTNRQLAYSLIVKLCDSGKVFVDVGSHIGLFVAMMEHHDPTVKIIGIEAMPDKIVNLRKRFPQAIFHEIAAGEQNGEAIFNIYPDRDGFSSLVNFLDNKDEAVNKIHVLVRKLDDIIDSEEIDTIKLIVEGGELGVIKGSRSILENSRPTVMFESSSFEDESTENTITNRWRSFNEFDYSIFIPNRVAHTAPPLTLESFVDSHEYPRRTLYYIAIPNERREEIMHKARIIQGV